ncbi:MAG: hypothetical protein R3B47_05875 [Bacteroidia bacterium]
MFDLNIFEAARIHQQVYFRILEVRKIDKTVGAGAGRKESGQLEVIKRQIDAVLRDNFKIDIQVVDRGAVCFFLVIIDNGQAVIISENKPASLTNAW